MPQVAACVLWATLCYCTPFCFFCFFGAIAGIEPAPLSAYLPTLLLLTVSYHYTIRLYHVMLYLCCTLQPPPPPHLHPPLLVSHKRHLFAHAVVCVPQTTLCALGATMPYLLSCLPCFNFSSDATNCMCCGQVKL